MRKLTVMAIGLFVLVIQMAAAEKPCEQLNFDKMSLEDLLNIPIVSATKTSTQLKDIPNKVVIISEQDIKRRN